MRSNLKIEKIDYRVNEEKRTVVCILNCDMQLEKHPAFGNYIYTDQWKKRMPKVSWDGEFNVSAVAKCNDDDTFDVETGKRIAESRAKKKAFGIARRVYGETYSKIMKAVTSIMMSEEACRIAESVEQNHIEELIG